MRVFVAGATGAIGRPLVSQLVASGHQVVGTTRTKEKAERLRAQGADPVVLDLLDAGALRDAVLAARPDAIVHEATALSGKFDVKHLDETFAETNRLRTEGTDALLAAADEIAVGRLIGWSYAGWPYAREGGPVKTEEDPLDPTPVPGIEETVTAMRHHEQAFLERGGIVLRYGGFYGSPNDAQIELIRKRQFPVVGGGGGMWSFVHVEDAAAATVLALERGAPGIYNIVDDEPAPVREWLPALAEAIGARPPRHVPRWLGKIFAGEPGVILMTEVRAASNAKAKRELGWTLRYPSWRDGFRAVYGDDATTARAA